MKSVIIITIVLITNLLFVSVQGEVQSLKTDKLSYIQTDKIVFSGIASTDDAGKEINLQITGPHGNYIDMFTTTVGVNGSFQIVLDTNIQKIQTEFTQPGTYGAIAFIQIRSSNPANFDYSPVPPPPPRPLSMQANHTIIQNNTQNPILSSHNPSINVTDNNNTTITPQVSSLQNRSSTSYQKSNDVNNNLESKSNQLKQSVVIPPTTSPLDCNTLPTDQIYKCQQNQMNSKITQEHAVQEQQQASQLQYQQEQQQILGEEQAKQYDIIGLVIFTVIIIAIVIAIKRRKSSIEKMRQRANSADNSHNPDNFDDNEWRGI